jgi:hypothetical protein
LSSKPQEWDIGPNRLAEQINTLCTGNIVKAAKAKRALQQQARAEEPVTTRIRRRREEAREAHRLSNDGAPAPTLSSVSSDSIRTSTIAR